MFTALCSSIEWLVGIDAALGEVERSTSGAGTPRMSATLQCVDLPCKTADCTWLYVLPGRSSISKQWKILLTLWKIGKLPPEDLMLV